MKKRTIKTALADLKFEQVPNSDVPLFGLWVKQYPVISTAVYFNHSTGQLFSIKFANDFEMFERVFDAEPKGLFTHIQKTDLLKSVNLQQIVTADELDQAMIFFEFRFETDMIERSSKNPYLSGDRVVCCKGSKGFFVGIVIGSTSGGVLVKTESGNVTVKLKNMAAVTSEILMTNAGVVFAEHQRLITSAKLKSIVTVPF